jgi:multiple sugar transport system substrate-binding protein
VPTAPGVITVWVHRAVGTGEFNAIRDAADEFNRSQHTYRVELSPTLSLYYDDRVQSAAATGVLPCLLDFDGPFLYAFAWPGYLQPIDRFAPKELLEDFLPSVIAQGTYGGHLYSLGQYDSGLGLWANRRYLRAAGIRIPTVAAPWSLTEFERVLGQLSTIHGIGYALEMNVYNNTATEFYAYAYAPILQGFGGDVIDRRTYRSARGVLDGPRSVAAMKHFQSWFKKGWAKADFNASDGFIEGKAALSWNGHWKYAAYRAALGGDLILLPLPNFGAGVKTGMGSWNWGISSTCHESEGAWRFLAYLLTDREILRMTNANGGVPARRSALVKSPLYGPSGPLRLFAQQLDAGYGTPRPATPAYSLVSRTFARAVRAIIGGSDVQSELGKAAETIDQDIAAHRGYPIQQ